MAACISGPLLKARPLVVAVALAFFSAGVLPAASWSDLAKVTAVRFWSLGDVTRIAIEVSDEFKFRSDRLPNPDRLFFDIKGAVPAVGPKKLEVIPVGDALLKQIRVAEPQPGVTRVVFDLEPHKPALRFEASQLTHPARLIIELRASAPEKPSAPLVSSEKPAPVFIPAPASGMVAKSVGPPASMSRWDLPEVRSPDPEPVSAPVPEKPAVLPLAAKRDTSGGRSLTRVLGLKLGRIVIDPGHGGHDVGTSGPSGLYEKEVVLDVARRLGALLESRLGSDVVYTRDDDTYIGLEERTRIANDHKADLFLSIHANSSPYRSAAGVETYYLNFTTSRTAMDVAARENASSERSIFELKDVLQKIALKDKIDESKEFAGRIQTSLSAISAKSNASAKDRGIKRAPFVVLIGASMPSVLAEIGFLTNSSDEALLRRPEHRQKIAEALYKGVAAYAENLSRFQVAGRQ